MKIMPLHTFPFWYLRVPIIDNTKTAIMWATGVETTFFLGNGK